MTSIDFVLTSEHVLFDHSGKLSVIGIFDIFNATELPFRFPQFFIVTRFSGDAGKYNLKVRITKKGNTKFLEEKVNPIEIREGRKIDFAISMVNFAFPEEGEYIVDVSLNGSSKQTTLTVASKKKK